MLLLLNNERKTGDIRNKVSVTDDLLWYVVCIPISKWIDLGMLDNRLPNDNNKDKSSSHTILINKSYVSIIYYLGPVLRSNRVRVQTRELVILYDEG